MFSIIACKPTRGDRAEASQSQQVHRRRAQRGHYSGDIAPVAVGVLMELGVTDPVPALNPSAVANQLQQGFWRCAEARNWMRLCPEPCPTPFETACIEPF